MGMTIPPFQITGKLVLKATNRDYRTTKIFLDFQLKRHILSHHLKKSNKIMNPDENDDDPEIR